MTYGEIWNGGPLPPISSPLYLPIADSGIAERLDRPGEEIPQGNPWLVHPDHAGAPAPRRRAAALAPGTRAATRVEA